MLTEGDKHQDCRYTKGQGITVVPKALNVISQDGRDEGGQEGSGIDTVHKIKQCSKNNKLLSLQLNYSR